MNTQLTNLLLALALNELIHVCSELWAVRDKVKRLATYIAGKPYKEMKLNIDTRGKSYAISIGIFLIVVPISYFGISLLHLSAQSAIVASIVLLVLSYVVAFVGFDRYHVDIENITRPFMHKK